MCFTGGLGVGARGMGGERWGEGCVGEGEWGG